jgi:hypothetical protein
MKQYDFKIDRINGETYALDDASDKSGNRWVLVGLNIKPNPETYKDKHEDPPPYYTYSDNLIDWDTKNMAGVLVDPLKTPPIGNELGDFGAVVQAAMEQKSTANSYRNFDKLYVTPSPKPSSGN